MTDILILAEFCRRKTKFFPTCLVIYTFHLWQHHKWGCEEQKCGKLCSATSIQLEQFPAQYVVAIHILSAKILHSFRQDASFHSRPEGGEGDIFKSHIPIIPVQIIPVRDHVDH
jgi:hypothetical protein